MATEQCHGHGAVVSIANFKTNSAGQSGESHVTFEHLDDLKDLTLNILTGKFFHHGILLP